MSGWIWVTAIVAIVGGSIVGYNYVDKAFEPVCKDQDISAISAAYQACMASWTGSAHMCSKHAVQSSCRSWARQ